MLFLFFLGHSTKLISQKFRHPQNELFFAQAAREQRCVNSTLFVNPCNFFLGIIDLQCCNYYHLLSFFHPNFNHP